MKSTSALPLIAALAAMANALALAAHGARMADGTPVLALDDSYIHLQYAWQAANGHFLQYNTADPPTTGETSLLYMLMLAVGFALGVTRQTMPYLVLVGGGLLFALSAALLSDLARRVAETLGGGETIPSWGTGLLAGLLFAGSGWMGWAFLSGMETGLLIALVVGTIWALSARRPILTVLFASLASLTRPEALILCVMLFVGEWFASDPPVGNRRPRLFLMLIPLAAGLIPLAINYTMTGSIASSSLQAKSLFTLVPFYPFSMLSMMATNVLDIFVRLYGGLSSDGHQHVLPIIQVFAVMGLGLMSRYGSAVAQRVALTCLGWVLLGTAATSTLETLIWQHYRYQIPFYPALLLPASLALTWILVRAMERLRRGVAVVTFLGGALATMLWTGYTLADFWEDYSLDTLTAAEMQVALAQWLQGNTPAEARIAVQDIGALRFLGERATIDMIGLTTRGMARAFRNGPGTIYEALETLQPDYTVVYPNIGATPITDLLGKEVFRVTLDPFSPYARALGTQIITQTDWSDVALAAGPQQGDLLARLKGWTLVDSLDVADLEEENAHAYRWWHQGTPAGFPSDAQRMRYRFDPTVTLADGGRALTGGESFTLHTLPGEELMLVARLHQTTDMILSVQVNNHEMGEWRLPAVPGEWLEASFLIPPERVTSKETRLTIVVAEMFDPLPEARYSPFHYWAYQRQEQLLPVPRPESASGAIFSEVVQLLGFDLPQKSVAAGDALPLTLYWQAVHPYRGDLRVFLHLVDPAKADLAEGIIAQFDSAPRRGTYPFWVWREQEMVSYTIPLAIPPDAPPGEYLLLLGIYDAQTGQRLPVLEGDDFGGQRLLLGKVSIQ